MTPPASPRFSYKSDKLKPLRAFCQTVRLGSVSRAADALFVSQPAITLQLQALERDLGMPLLERNGRRLAPTREGEVLYEMAVPLVEQLDGLEAGFRERVRAGDGPSRGWQRRPAWRGSRRTWWQSCASCALRCLWLSRERPFARPC